jgi:hypothetical protein
MEVPAEVDEQYNNSVAVRQVWRVVCLAALNAMWHYTCHVMNASQVSRDAWQAEGGHGTRGQVAVIKFREMLEDFARVGSPPKAWQRVLPSNAPFFRYSADHTLQVVPMQ